MRVFVATVVLATPDRWDGTRADVAGAVKQALGGVVMLYQEGEHLAADVDRVDVAEVPPLVVR